MRSGCVEPVVGMSNSATVYPISQVMRIRLNWNPEFQYAETSVSEWMERRKYLLQRLMPQLEVWAQKYLRHTECARNWEEMEITEYGVTANFV
jgi:hypothetical protein